MQLYQSPDGSRADLPGAEHRHRLRARTRRRRAPGQALRLRDRHLPADPRRGRDDPRHRVLRRQLEQGAPGLHRSRHGRALPRRDACSSATASCPATKGRGYVLRRVLRRAIYLARKAGVTQPFTARLADAAIDKLKVGYPHLEENRDFIQRALNAEEDRFIRTLAGGIRRLDDLLERLATSGTKSSSRAAKAFLLYDTFGMPIELIDEIGLAAGFTLDRAGFESALEAQRELSRAERPVPQGRGLAAAPVARRRALRLRRLRPHGCRCGRHRDRSRRRARRCRWRGRRVRSRPQHDAVLPGRRRPGRRPRRSSRRPPAVSR